MRELSEDYVASFLNPHEITVFKEVTKTLVFLLESNLVELVSVYGRFRDLFLLTLDEVFRLPALDHCGRIASRRSKLVAPFVGVESGEVLRVLTGHLNYTIIYK